LSFSEHEGAWTVDSPQDEALFGRWLRKRRKALDLTQKLLARRVGCSPSTIRKLEADVRHSEWRLRGHTSDTGLI
jgi:hypothetical protein